MKNFEIPKQIAVAFSAMLLFASALLVILASNEAYSSYSHRPIDIRTLIITLYAAVCLGTSVWLAFKAFSENKKLSVLCIVIAVVCAIGCIAFGVSADAISTGPFGIGGCMLLLAALVYAVAFLYKHGCNKLCTAMEITFLIINLVLFVGSVILLTKETILPQAAVLTVMTLAFSLSAASALVYRFIKKSKDFWIKKCISLFLLIGLVAYTVAFSAALCCTQIYTAAFKMPTALIASAIIDDEVTVHKNFAGESAALGIREIYKADAARGAMNHKRAGKYFTSVYNYAMYTFFYYS